MGKSLYIAEKPSVAKAFAAAMKEQFKNMDGYMESQNSVVTWCVGHLITMSYPDAYDPLLKRWSFDTIPFIPKEYKYEVIPGVDKQFKIVKGLLNRSDVETIYVCTDSGREGEYIYRLVEQESGVTGKIRKRVWIDSQTEEEIMRGIHQAKDLSEYDDLSDAAYLRAQEDYLMGINFSRVLTLKYGNFIKNYLKAERGVVSVGRVMTCVLGLVVTREREIRNFVKTPFYRVIGNFSLNENTINGEWRSTSESAYYQSPLLYKENGFAKKEDAQKLIEQLSNPSPISAQISKVEKKTEKKNAPQLFNLAELQNTCSKLFKISPDQTLAVAQELYEKKLTTYPRTDARVLSKAICKEIHKNIGGLGNYPICRNEAAEVLKLGLYKTISNNKRYVDDSKITDHYAIIPTGQGFGALPSLSPTTQKVYEIIVRRFLAIFYPPAVYQKVGLTIGVKSESFFASFKVMTEEGYTKVTNPSFLKDKTDKNESKENGKNRLDRKDNDADIEKEEEQGEIRCTPEFLENLSKLRKGTDISCLGFEIKEGETSPPKRYTTGSMILAMENAGQLIEDEEMRAQIKGSGIGTSATRAGILTKLETNKYLSSNKKTQVITPTLLGEMIYDVVNQSIRGLLNPVLTASWEKGLSGVASGTISKEEYTQKMNQFVTKHTQNVKGLQNQAVLYKLFDRAAQYYKK
ncbi:MAG: DNA topoisomerase [Lachnospiraceae bacterium]